MADSDGFKCPECKTNHTIAELELWELYSSDDARECIDCPSCQKEIVIYSTVVSWSFKAYTTKEDEELF